MVERTLKIVDVQRMLECNPNLVENGPNVVEPLKIGSPLVETSPDMLENAPRILPNAVQIWRPSLARLSGPSFVGSVLVERSSKRLEPSPGLVEATSDSGRCRSVLGHFGRSIENKNKHLVQSGTVDGRNSEDVRPVMAQRNTQNIFNTWPPLRWSLRKRSEHTPKCFVFADHGI